MKYQENDWRSNKQQLRYKSFLSKITCATNTRSTYLVTKPVPLTSIFLKRTAEKNEGSLQISLVTDLNSVHAKETMEISALDI